jgi:hypothetical protein
MSKILIFLIFLVCAFTINPPLWPDSFSQDYVVGDNKAKLFTVGKIWYDFNNKMERNDLQNSLFDAICSSVSNASNTPCISINREENLHIWLPELKQCCRCCSAANGCTVTAQNWLANFTFMGE